MVPPDNQGRTARWPFLWKSQKPLRADEVLFDCISTL
jgi:hypothetical protein